MWFEIIVIMFVCQKAYYVVQYNWNSTKYIQQSLITHRDTNKENSNVTSPWCNIIVLNWVAYCIRDLHTFTEKDSVIQFRTTARTAFYGPGSSMIMKWSRILQRILPLYGQLNSSNVLSKFPTNIVFCILVVAVITEMALNNRNCYTGCLWTL